MSEDQKKMAIQQLEASLTLMNTYAKSMSNSANVSVVRQYSGKIKILLDQYGE